MPNFTEYTPVPIFNRKFIRHMIKMQTGSSKSVHDRYEKIKARRK